MPAAISESASRKKTIAKIGEAAAAIPTRATTKSATPPVMRNQEPYTL
jgi:hypothetical protein